jgi:dipeptidase
MCDTLIATRQVTADGIAIFAKNSDRQPNEAQYLTLLPSADHPQGSKVKCTYIEIPQAKHTYKVLLSKPFWIWGAEMGVNEHNVVIGNEAIFSKIPAEKEGKLIGMDLLRLGLERGSTAKEAMETIIALLEEFGQGGNCGFAHEMYYHNSFLIADPNDTWVLETVSKQWAARQIKQVYSISNCLTIGSQWDMASKDLVSLAVQKGWASSPQHFDYAKDYSDFIYTTFGRGRIRRAFTFGEMQEEQGKIAVTNMMNYLRSHTADANDSFGPQNGLATIDVCMHSGFGPIRSDQSTSSMVVHLDAKRPTIFVTGTSAPCTSIFKPIWMDIDLPDVGPDPVGTYDSESLFWSHERLHRATLQDYATRLAAYKTDRDALEAEFIEGALKRRGKSARERGKISAECFAKAAAAEAEWLKRVESIPARSNRAWLYNSAWNKYNKEAKMPNYQS